MKKLPFILYFMVTLAYAQDSIVISGQLKGNTKYAKVVVQQFGVGSFPIAAVNITNERFSINAPKNIQAGIYRFQYGQTNPNEYVDIIINGQENHIAFALHVANNELPTFQQSSINQQWYSYQKQAIAQQDKIELLHQFLQYYPTQEPLYKTVTKEYETQKNKYLKQHQTFVKNNPNWAGWAVANTPIYFPNPKDHPKIQDFNRRTHYWDNIDTTNPKLLNSPIYVELILKYLQYYMNPDMQFSEQEQTEGFIKSVDTIMQKFLGNEETKKFALQYLQLGFKEIGQEKVLQHIDEKYQNEIKQCQDDTQKAEFENRMAGYAAMKEGNQAPNITLANYQTLYDIKSEQTLVVFWASWCPHCMEEMPKINQWATENPNTKVVAISLDEDKTAYESTIKKFSNLLHHCDFKKWESPAVKDYYIYGTPTFILLDKDKKIIGKYSSFNQVKK